MNEYIFYTTEGHTEGRNPEYPVENCQLLGIAKGITKEEALKSLLEENTWIEEAGFSIYNIMSRQLANEA